MADNTNYQKMNDELEAMIAKLQQDDMDIDEAMQAYERGLELVKKLETYLKTAENKVTKLKVAHGTVEE